MMSRDSSIGNYYTTHTISVQYEYCAQYAKYQFDLPHLPEMYRIQQNTLLWRLYPTMQCVQTSISNVTCELEHLSFYSLLN